jgi:hypothetical protein
MESYSDSDTSSESDYESSQGSTPGSDCDDDELSENIKPELSEPIDEEYDNAPWNPQAQLDAIRLAQLHADIKASAQLPIPTYPKLPRTWPARPFDVRTLPNYVRYPIHYFELFWDSSVWNTLVENTNAYAQYKEARNKHNNKAEKSRWWKAVTLYEMRIFIALIIYIGIIGTQNIKSFWVNGTKEETLTIHKPMAFMTFYRFQQIKRYFHVSPPPTTSIRLPLSHWYLKLEPLASLLRTKFKTFVVLGQNVSFDEMMVPYSGRSKHTLKMKNKLIKEGFKIWALCDRGYLWDFLFYSRTSCE